jgi:serine/threonine protein kinase
MKSLQCFKQSSGGGNGCGPGKRLERRLSLGEYKKAVSWSKYLIAPPGARIRGGGEELWSADLSKLEIRGKFASGRHSRVYSGRYAGREVAIKMVSQPEEDAALATELERQFASEVALLLRLHHPNIISVRTYFCVFFFTFSKFKSILFNFYRTIILVMVSWIFFKPADSFAARHVFDREELSWI